MPERTTHVDPSPPVPSPRSDTASTTTSATTVAVEPLSHLRLPDVDRVGGKGADLGEMPRHGDHCVATPVPRAVRSATRATGVFFAACAVGNAVSTLRRARPFLEWCRDGAWLPPYPAVLERLVPVAPWVVGGTVLLEAGIAALLLDRRRQEAGLWLATAFVVGVSPAIAYPYWTANVPQALLYAGLARRQHR
jgi:hypothetical protein